MPPGQRLSPHHLPSGLVIWPTAPSQALPEPTLWALRTPCGRSLSASAAALPGHFPLARERPGDAAPAYGVGTALPWLAAPLEAARQASLGACGGLPGGPLGLAAALAGMVAYNGGRPLTCHA